MLALKHEPSRIDPLRFLFHRYTKIPDQYRTPKEAFRQKVPIDFERGDFQVKTLGSAAELEEVLQLRYDIFHREFQNKFFPYGIDLEELDFIADHLVIIHKPSKKIVGTYRIVASTFSNAFYSQSEFKLEEFLKLPGAKMELSRAGIHRGFRSGVVMALLWRGVSKYMQEIQAQYIFGCASVKTVSRRDVNSITNALNNLGVLSDSFEIHPTPAYQMPKELHFSEVERKIPLPALFEGYLRAGAVVCPEPALDRAFKCVDFFTILNVSMMDKKFERKYAK